MDALLFDAIVGIGGIAAVGGLASFAAYITTKPKAVAKPDNSGIPLIEIDGRMVPHPTIVARRARRKELLNK